MTDDREATLRALAGPAGTPITATECAALTQQWIDETNGVLDRAVDSVIAALERMTKSVDPPRVLFKEMK